MISNPPLRSTHPVPNFMHSRTLGAVRPPAFEETLRSAQEGRFITVSSTKTVPTTRKLPVLTQKYCRTTSAVQDSRKIQWNSNLNTMRTYSAIHLEALGLRDGRWKDNVTFRQCSHARHPVFTRSRTSARSRWSRHMYPPGEHPQRSWLTISRHGRDRVVT